jgi:hypothetical protein
LVIRVDCHNTKQRQNQHSLIADFAFVSVPLASKAVSLLRKLSVAGKIGLIQPLDMHADRREDFIIP